MSPDFLSEARYLFIEVRKRTFFKFVAKKFHPKLINSCVNFNIFQKLHMLNYIMNLLMTVFKLRSMFCGQMCAKTIDNTLVSIQPFACFNLVVHRPSFQKNIGFTSKYSCKQLKIGKEYQKIGETCCFLGTSFLLYLYAPVNIYTF